MRFGPYLTVFLLVVIFLSVQALGLFTGSEYIKAIEAGIAQPLVENPQDVSNSALIFLYILAVTGLVILIIKFKKALLLALEAVAIFFTSWIVFSALTPFDNTGIVALLLAFALTAIKEWKPTILTQNIALVFSTAGAGGVLGASLGILPVLIFMLLLACYDFFAVFISKHMVYMAKAITEKPMAFTAALPCDFGKPRKLASGKGTIRTRVFQLGGGDLVIPLMFSVAVLNYYTLQHALITTAGAFIALLALFAFVIRKPGIALPALPPVCAGACIAFAASVLFL
jgi:presenilin-like A22 family membrane protease